MNDAEIGSATRTLVAAWLDWHDSVNKRERHSELTERVVGYRVVDGGQTGLGDSWTVTDADTGELLAAGTGHQSFEAAWQGHWVHVDEIVTEALDETPEPADDFGLPQSLVQALADWVTEHPDEARAVIEP